MGATEIQGVNMSKTNGKTRSTTTTENQAQPETGGKKKSGEFFATDAGVFYRETDAKDQEHKTFVCSPLEVIAKARDVNDESWGRLLRWKDDMGKQHEWLLPAKMLAGDGGSAYRETLADGGLEINPKAYQLLAQYIWRENPSLRMRCVPHVGWLDKTFVFPDSTVPPDAGIAYQSDSRIEHFYRSKGTLESWQKNIAQYCPGNDLLLFGVSTGFAAPLFRLLNVGGGGFHIYGGSSTGKSTMQLVVGSVWGGGGPTGYVRGWSTTQNGLEFIAELHNDGPLILDEIRMLDPRSVETISYMLANGSGKIRQNRTLTGRRTLDWRILTLSSGEIKLREAAALAHQIVRAGAEIRLASIPADAGKGMGIFEELHSFRNPREFAEILDAAAREHYGTAIRPYLGYITENYDQVIAQGIEQIDRYIRTQTEKISERYPDFEISSEVLRVLRRFIATGYGGEVATEAGITGWSKNEAMRAALHCFWIWLMDRGGTRSTDVINGLCQIQRILLRDQHSRFASVNPKPLRDQDGEIVTQAERDENGEIRRDEKGEPICSPVYIETRIPNILGYRTEIRGEPVFAVLGELFRTELCEGYDSRSLARELQKQELLHSDNDDRHKTLKIRVTDHYGTEIRPRVYAIRTSVLEKDFVTEPYEDGEEN